MLALNAGNHSEAVFELRIGIHLADVLYKTEADIFGDGPIVATRLQALAPVGGVLISHAVYTQLQPDAAAMFAFAGEVPLENIPHHYVVWQWGGSADWTPETAVVASEKTIQFARPATISGAGLAIGSGNGDFVLDIGSDFRMGAKNFGKAEQMIGGSGVNLTLRLLAGGVSAIPVLSIGKDWFGELVQKTVKDAVSSYGLNSRRGLMRELDFVSSDAFFCKDIKTPQSIVIIGGDIRTIIAQKLEGGERFLDFALARIDDAKVRFPVAGVIIGHIHTDGHNGAAGACTKAVIEIFKDDPHCPVFLNFGANQITHKADFWSADMRMASLVQMNMSESRQFFEGTSISGLGLHDMIRWYQQHEITSVITFGRLGAVGSYRNGADGIIFAAAAEIPDRPIIDATGAGDAFCAGMMSVLNGTRDFSFSDFMKAMQTGRVWASYACTTKGAVGHCPDPGGLEDYTKEFAVAQTMKLIQPLTTQSLSAARQILGVIEKINADTY